MAKTILNFLFAWLACTHRETVLDTSEPGVIRLRCTACLRVSSGVDLGAPKYRRTA